MKVLDISCILLKDRLPTQHSNTIQKSRAASLVSKIKEITDRFQSKLNLSENLEGSHIRSPVLRSPRTCLPTEYRVYVREKDKEAIIEMLLTDKEYHGDVSVISIVGMGGLGKTTLARLVYNDTNVKHNFHKRVWLCVSSNFDVMSITNTLYESVTGVVTHHSEDLNTLQAMLTEELSKSKLLLVLDDVWNEDNEKWGYLCRPFQLGSRIIITTRIQRVASMVGSRAAYHLKPLSDDDCLSILAQHSGLSFHENPEFEAVGVELANKCKGTPLTAATLGGLLRSKETKENWGHVLHSIIIGDHLGENIHSVLSLSYHNLPSHMKPLFAYCSIFPKDYNFKKNELIYLWMGEGFLDNLDDSKSEELGIKFFNELLSRSFFQRSADSDEYFAVHDLMHELAQSAAIGTCYHLDTIRMYEIPYRARHVSFLRHEDEVFRKFQAFSTARRLRAFLPMPVQTSVVWPSIYLSNDILAKLVQEMHSLRVLSLSAYSITELPSSVCNLIHLRYLNLSGTSIITLPDTLGDIYNLRTLSLHKCRSLRKLPSTLGKLSNLRHLDNSDTDQLKDMPVEIGKLKKTCGRCQKLF